MKMKMKRKEKSHAFTGKRNQFHLPATENAFASILVMRATRQHSNSAATATDATATATIAAAAMATTRATQTT